MKVNFNTLENEKVLGSSDGDNMVLTSQRIHYNTGSLFGGEYITMNLEDVSSLEVKHSSSLFFYICAGLGIIFMIFLDLDQRQETLMITTSIVTLVFVTLYLFSRKKIISICSKGASRMNIPVNKMSGEEIAVYLDRIAKAKDERLKELYK
jgi:hypothetical protein